MDEKWLLQPWNDCVALNNRTRDSTKLVEYRIEDIVVAELQNTVCNEGYPYNAAVITSLSSTVAIQEGWIGVNFTVVSN